ncbi:MAG: ABC transporter ATP-binding protein [Pseudanabaenaceae cyanobacterium SKYGB_i_bin29]|nr:ABC transporter ATP-binding protein [Pseudanabaenaceae cyanobacterium SKYG29]MDW8421743.1 ABC transporter ATP-binding protein [Pseudanabaenaceae cyanobacterium SKYGB_i_bin29]
MAALISLRDVRKSFGQNVVLDGISLDIYAGEAVAIIGPSGTGKSTVLKIMCGLLEPDAGEVWLNGEKITQVGGSNSVHVGMVFQQAALFDSLTVAENVGFTLWQNGCLKPKEILAIVEQKLAMVGLTGILDRYPSQLSGGMRKRVSFARAITEDPRCSQTAQKILLYDEPTAGLDPIASTIIEDLIRDLKVRQKVCDSYVVVTHQHSTIRRTSDRVIFLYQGKIRWEGATEEVDRADNPYLRQFFSGSTEGPIQFVGREV